VALVTYLEAARGAILEEMARDPRVFVMGQDLHAGQYADALARFGRARIRNTPISEAGFIGAGIGAALTGMRPVIEGSVSTFLYSAMDQIVNQAAKSRYMFGGQASVPIVIRSTVYYMAAAAAHHSDRPWAMFAQIPGLKIVVPSTPHDAKGLLTSAIRDHNPVLCFDDYTLFDLKEEVPQDTYLIPIGRADIKRRGSDLTIVAIGGSVIHSMEAAQELAHAGISSEVVDLRSLVPLDRETLLHSVAKTGRLIVVDPAVRTCGVAAEIAAIVAEEAFSHLRSPIIRITAPSVSVPFSPQLERLVYPNVRQIVAAGRRLCDG
jgi:acetoin:2,6-dichlorophenolindophenol oxidoreductase subunit beta